MKTQEKVFCDLFHRKGGRIALSGLYRVRLGRREGQGIWIVDGFKVVRDLYPPFVMGGNDQRYRFNPDDDIWIDNRIGVEELEYTIAHELIERRLMLENGMTYEKAHNQGLALEKKMRVRHRRSVKNHARKVDSMLLPFLRMPFGRARDGVRVFIVDGPLVRRELDGDFCFGANDLAADYVPAGEIWLDSAMSCEHAYYALLHQREERRRLASGMPWDDAYESALALRIAEQSRQEGLALRHESRLQEVAYGVRERGVKRA
ncbi:MAG: hypothetical protein AB7W16_01370 [Candidatus Obscuribacterales bacterium]